MTPKTIFVNFSINKRRYRANFDYESELQKYLRVFSYQIQSLTDYFYDFLNTYRFYSVGFSYKGISKNFPSYSFSEDGANEQSLIDLARSFNITATDTNSVLFEWESKFIEKVTEFGIEQYIKTYFKYAIVDMVNSFEEAEEISNLIRASIFEWHSAEVSEVTSNVYTTDKNDLTISIELSLPKEFFSIISGVAAKIKNMFSVFKSVLAIGITIKFIEIIWR